MRSPSTEARAGEAPSGEAPSGEAPSTEGPSSDGSSPGAPATEAGSNEDASVERKCWLRRRLRRWRRAWAARRCARSLPPAVGEVVLALCHPSGRGTSPVLRTVFTKGLGYSGFDDVEIRGFLDGQVKFERNVATQYHVRVGCEGSKPVDGRYEVMRVLLRWDVSALPREAHVRSVRLVLHQEDCTRFPHRYPLRWPVDVYIYEVRKPWGAGRGGVDRDNLSHPERGDAWWIEARAGELPWREPGCGHADDEDPEADRTAAPLAWARLESPDQELCLAGPPLQRYVEEALAGAGHLSILLKASGIDEALPGSVKTFFSGEFGDDLHPRWRPRLEVEWTAPCLAVDRRSFAIEPGTAVVLSPRLPPGTGDSSAGDSSAGGSPPADCILVASLDVPRGLADAGLTPEVSVEGWTPLGAPDGSGAPPGLLDLRLPVRGAPAHGFRVRVSAAVNPVVAGSAVEIKVLETWKPAVDRPEDLSVSFLFTAPSSRTIEVRGSHAGDHVYAARMHPDEPGVWSYAWRTRPDSRFREQRGGGHFSVVPGDGPSYLEFLRNVAEEAMRGSTFKIRLVARRRTHFRLTVLQRELRSLLTRELATDPRSEVAARVRDLIRKIAAFLPRVE